MGQQNDTVITALAASGAAFGVVAAVVPGALLATYGMPGEPGMRWAMRGWGTRTAALGALGLTAKGEGRRAVLSAVAALSAADVVIAAVAAPGLSTRARLQAAVTSGAFATIAALVRSAA